MSLARLAATGLALVATAVAAQAPAPRFDGIWDLTWQTRSGPRQSGYLVVSRSGAGLSAEIHGRGSIRASGSANGSSFVLRGSRMLVSYRLEGRIAGDRMEGVLKVLSVERRFTGLRRPR
jgi:hypothetical protein